MAMESGPPSTLQSIRFRNFLTVLNKIILIFLRQKTLVLERNDPPTTGKEGQEMAKRRLNCVAAMQQYQRKLSRIRRTVHLVIHPKAIDGRVFGLSECAGMHGGETTILQ
jgi:hypothetical protein